MKKIFSLLLVTLFMAISFDSISQGSAPPPPPTDPSAGNNPPVGGGAPVGSGLLILLTMGAAYGVKKYTDARKESESEIND